MQIMSERGELLGEAAQEECSCGSIGRTDLRQCKRCHRIWNGDRRLASVTSIVAKSFPIDPSIPVSVLENARERGTAVDRLFSDYVRGTLKSIPAGTRCDARDLFFKLQKWYDLQRFSKVEAQVLLGDEDHGGILDFRFDGVPFELKATYNVMDSHRLQAAAYCRLVGRFLRDAYVLHITERFTMPRLVPLTTVDHDDWLVMLDHFRMLQRRSKGKALDEAEEKED